jgi:hypothetical protein
MPTLIVKTLTGKKLFMEYNEDESIHHLKQSIQEKEGIPVDQIKLILSGKQSSDNQSYTHYKIIPGSIIHMALQL